MESLSLGEFIKKKNTREFPGGQDLELSSPRARIRSSVGELRSCKLLGEAKKKKKKERKRTQDYTEKMIFGGG